MDILIGIHCADLHLVVADLEHHKVSGLTLLTIQFGSIFLLDGRHPDICSDNGELFNRAHSIGHATLWCQLL